MNQYAILRRSGWAAPEELQAAAERSREILEREMPDEIHWIRSYILQEAGGRLGTVCIYEATGEDAVRRHAAQADLPVDEVVRVGDVVVVRPDPDPVA